MYGKLECGLKDVLKWLNAAISVLWTVHTLVRISAYKKLGLFVCACTKRKKLRQPKMCQNALKSVIIILHLRKKIHEKEKSGQHISISFVINTYTSLSSPLSHYYYRCSCSSDTHTVYIQLQFQNGIIKYFSILLLATAIAN